MAGVPPVCASPGFEVLHGFSATRSHSFSCALPLQFQNEHNHPKPGQVRGQGGRPSFGGSGGLYRHSSIRAGALQQHEQQQQQEPGPELSSHDLQQEDAIAALTAMKYSPVVPGMLGSAQQDTPTTLLPIPASLRASLEPEDPQTNGWAVPHRLHRSSSGGRGAAAAEDRDESELSGWRCCAVCGIRLDISLPLAAWHMQQHLQAQRAADALNGHMQHLRRRPPRPPGLCVNVVGPRRLSLIHAAAALAVAGGWPVPVGYLPAQTCSHPCLLPSS